MLYPPCDVTVNPYLKLNKPRENYIISIGQFRPEKDHALQIRAFKKVLEMHPEFTNTKLILIGSCRFVDDERRVQQLQKICIQLEIQDSVEFMINQPYHILQQYLARANVGLHTMWNEHFGIGIVEMMASGLIVIAHDSGGPKYDIVMDAQGGEVGYLASKLEEYVERLVHVLGNGVNSDGMKRMRVRVMESVQRFGDVVFEEKFELIMKDSGLL